MKSFLSDDFLLDTETARTLYHTYAAPMSIADYHCHIDPKDIWEDRRFENITQIWLGGDHYKWRLMRSNGVEEKYITGDASDWEKFEKFAQTLPRAIGTKKTYQGYYEKKTNSRVGSQRKKQAAEIADQEYAIMARRCLQCRA